MNSVVHNPEQCGSVRASFSEYLDCAVSGHEMYAITFIFRNVPIATRNLLPGARCNKVFPLSARPKSRRIWGLKLRVTISQLKARKESRWTDRLALRWENAVRPLVIQASAGFAGTIVFVGGVMLLLGMVAAPQAVMAHDIPLGAMTAPHYLYSAANERPIIAGKDTTIVVEAAINASGQVYDYKIVSGPESPDVEKQIAEHLMLSVFEPARVFDSPVRGRVIVTFDGISVRG